MRRLVISVVKFVRYVSFRVGGREIYWTTYN